MRFTVVVPEPIQDEINRWALPIDVEEELYRRLQADLEYGHEFTCPQVPAPSPTYIFKLTLQDPSLLGVSHGFTFYLTYGPLDDALYVRDCSHESRESWDDP